MVIARKWCNTIILATKPISFLPAHLYFTYFVCLLARFESGANGTPPIVFFPLSDPGERLSQCSTSLQALLFMPRNALTPLSKLLTNFEAGEAIIQIVSTLSELLSTTEYY